MPPAEIAEPHGRALGRHEHQHARVGQGALAAPALAADVTVTLPAGDGFVIEDNTGTTERLRVDEATGNISRNGALFVHTTGTANDA